MAQLEVRLLMFARLRDEQGMTLPELLVALSIGLIVTFASLTLVEVTMRRSGEISARTDAVQRGRGAMDLITRQLRSQVCIPRTTGTNDPRKSFEAADPSSLTFYVDMHDSSNFATPTPTPTPGTYEWPQKHKLTYADGTITETVWKPSGPPVNGVYSFASTPTTRTLLASVEQAIDKATGQPIPVFQYYAFNFTVDPPQPTTVLAGTLTSAQMERIAKVKITYTAQPQPKRADGRAYTVFTNEVYARTVDPNAKVDELSKPCL